MGLKEYDYRVPNDAKPILNENGKVIGIATHDASFDYSKEGKNFLQSNFQNAIDLLPEHGYSFEQDGSIITTRVIRGYKGDRTNPEGIYEFVERTEGENKTYILTHDTLDGNSIKRAVMIENGCIREAEGFNSLNEKVLLEEIKSFFGEFNGCKSYTNPSRSNSTGIHYSS